MLLVVPQILSIGWIQAGLKTRLYMQRRADPVQVQPHVLDAKHAYCY